MELMKNGLGPSAIKRISNAFTRLSGNFDSESFEKFALDNLSSLELKQRVHHIIEVLQQHLSKDILENFSLFKQIKRVWDHGNTDDPFRSFAAWPIIDYIAVYGVEYPEESLDLMAELTSIFSAEFAVRPFIKQFPQLCHERFKLWFNSEDEHVRRLVSEGTRPRLPWGMKLQQFIDDPMPNIPLLTQLKNDPSLYVRRSVANHLNDIAKDNTDVVIETCQKWHKDASAEVLWVIKHATRTLVKQGEPRIFSLLGYTDKPKIDCSELSLSAKNIKMGEQIDFTFSLQSKSEIKQKVVIDYALYFVKANNDQKPKIFKLKNLSLQAKSKVTLQKTFSFKAISTRKYYPGVHKVEILINGISQQSIEFLVKE